MSEAPDRPYLTARQAAAYLQVNEKKLYELANRREVPAARVGGKWLFPRELIDRWLTEQAHGGLLADRLLVGGAEDALLQVALGELGERLGNGALVAHVPTHTAHGLGQLAAHRIDACALHWGPAEGSDAQHAALLQRQRECAEWTAVRIGWREHGVMLRPGLAVDQLVTLVGYDYRWILQPPGAGTRYALQLALAQAGCRLDDCGDALRIAGVRGAAALLASGQADCAAGSRAIAAEHGLGFLPLGVEALDLALPRPVFFRRLFQDLLEVLASPEMSRRAGACGYDLAALGRVIELGAG